MSFITNPAKYDSRRIRDWMAMADMGAIALPTFQRSYVWDNERIAAYLKALFENRPTEIFLTLKVGENLSFESRTLRGVEADRDKAKELVLDGQQRLTSLWSALKRKATHRFFVRVVDLRNRNMTVGEVHFYSPKSSKGKAMNTPRNAY